MNKVFINSVLFVFLWSNFSAGLRHNSPVMIARHMDALVQADSAYSQGKFARAADILSDEMSFVPQAVMPSVRFKYAVSLYRSGRNRQSLNQLDSLRRHHPEYLPDYITYFRIRNLWALDSARAAEAAETFIKKHPRLSLADSLILPLADNYFRNKDYNNARRLYDLFRQWKVDKSQNAYARIQSAMCLYHGGRRKWALAEFRQIISRYARNEKTLALAEWLKENEADFFQKHIFKMVKVYSANRSYRTMRRLLEAYIKTARTEEDRERARFYLIEYYYFKKRYNEAFYGFNNMLKGLRNKNLEPKIRLYLARIHLRKGRKSKAIEMYRDYARRYPRRRLAPEAIWKAAWIAEEQRQMELAFDLYTELQSKWPRNALAREARFRAGFTLYRLGRMEEAAKVFENISAARYPDVDKNRAAFWKAACALHLKDTLQARAIYKKLATHVWDDYYTLKSYLLVMPEDSLTRHVERLKEDKKLLQYQSVGYLALIDAFEQAFEVREVLNDAYAYAALEDTRLKINSLEQWVALAEIYKKFGAYGKAYRTYDRINRIYFSDIPYTRKAFILKQRFPFYYDNLVEAYSRKNKLEAEFVLALMKQESLFDFKAHSWANAYGLMQLIPATAREMAAFNRECLTHPRQLFDPEFNIRLGTTYLNYLSRRFNGQKEKILAAYNAGPHRVKRWQKLPGSSEVDVFIENIEYEQTRDYVRKVMKNYWAYVLLHREFNLPQEALFGSLD